MSKSFVRASQKCTVFSTLFFFKSLEKTSEKRFFFERDTTNFVDYTESINKFAKVARIKTERSVFGNLQTKRVHLAY